MTYQDLLEELQGYSTEELKQNVTFLICSDNNFEIDDEISLEDIDWITAYNQNDQIVIVV
jgi:hypothetical protein